MDINDQRDFDEEAANRAAMEKEGIEEALAEATEVIGGDYFFLLSARGEAPYVALIKDMVESIERDAFYPDESPRVADARIFLVISGKAPVEVYPTYTIITSNSAWVTKVMKIHNEAGELIAQAPYQIPTLELLNG